MEKREDRRRKKKLLAIVAASLHMSVSARLLCGLMPKVWKYRCPLTLANAGASYGGGNIPTGFHCQRPLLARRSASAFDPVITFERSPWRGGKHVPVSHLRWDSERLERVMPRRADDGDHGALGKDGTLRNVIVTGANRGLGFAIADRMLAIGGFRVALACRSQEEGDAALERLLANQQKRQRSKLKADLLATVHPLDVSCPRDLAAFREKCIDGYLGGRVDVLFNNAGVCLPSEIGDKAVQNYNTAVAATAGILRETLEVNFFGALAVVDACLPALMAAANAPAAAEEATQAEEQPKSKLAVLAPPTVVWITSGDGELCLLGDKWRRLLADAESLEEVELHMSNLLTSASETETAARSKSDMKRAAAVLIQHPGEKQAQQAEAAAAAAAAAVGEEEMAFGPTPAYSLSKAAANAAVRTWAPRLISPPAGRCSASDSNQSSARCTARGIRLVAVCPGDVLTRMTSSEEMARGDAVPPEEAAVAVVDVALGSALDFPTGRFYRHREEIGW